MKDLGKKLLKLQHKFLKGFAKLSDLLYKKATNPLLIKIENLSEIMYTDKELEERKQEALKWLDSIPSDPIEQKGPINVAFKSCEGCIYLREYHKLKIHYPGKSGIEMLGPACNLMKIGLNFDNKNKIIQPTSKCPYI